MQWLLDLSFGKVHLESHLSCSNFFSYPTPPYSLWRRREMISKWWKSHLCKTARNDKKETWQVSTFTQAVGRWNMLLSVSILPCVNGRSAPVMEVGTDRGISDCIWISDLSPIFTALTPHWASQGAFSNALRQSASSTIFLLGSSNISLNQSEATSPVHCTKWHSIGSTLRTLLMFLIITSTVFSTLKCCLCDANKKQTFSVAESKSNHQMSCTLYDLFRA